MEEKKKMLSFINLRTVPPMMNWDDIKIGEEYHLPPLIYNKRMDFVVVEKTDNLLKIIKKQNGEDYKQTMFRTDVTARFITKKINLHGYNT
jgi:hypothetical protein